MRRSRTLRILLPPSRLERTKARDQEFFNLIEDVVTRAGYRVRLLPSSLPYRIATWVLPGYALIEQQHTPMPWQIMVRRSYSKRYWHFERTNHRRDWTSTNAVFDPREVPRTRADQLFARHRKGQKIDSFATEAERPFVYIPLQAQLLQRRSFQSMSPIDMVRTTAQHERHRRLIVTTHPTVTYSSREKRALAQLAEDPRIEVTTAPMHQMLAACDYVVAQNSTVAFHGHLHRKSAVLFATCDFHHPHQSVLTQPIDQAFRRVLTEEVDHAGYRHWLLTHHAVFERARDPREQIGRRLEELGLPL